MTDIDVAISKFLAILLQSILVVVIPVLVVQARSWLQAMGAAAWAQFGVQQQALLRQVSSLAVQAAEQSGLAGLILNEGRAKKDLAMAIVERMLGQYGVTMESDVISSAIEAAVNTTSVSSRA